MEEDNDDAPVKKTKGMFHLKSFLSHLTGVHLAASKKKPGTTIQCHSLALTDWHSASKGKKNNVDTFDVSDLSERQSLLSCFLLTYCRSPSAYCTRRSHLSFQH